MKHKNAGGCPYIGVHLRLLRKHRYQTLQQVADGIGSSKSHVYELESGRNLNPTIGTVVALANHFGVTVNYFLKPVGGRTP